MVPVRVMGASAGSIAASPSTAKNGIAVVKGGHYAIEGLLVNHRIGHQQLPLNSGIGEATAKLASDIQIALHIDRQGIKGRGQFHGQVIHQQFPLQVGEAAAAGQVDDGFPRHDGDGIEGHGGLFDVAADDKSIGRVIGSPLPVLPTEVEIGGERCEVERSPRHRNAAGKFPH